MRILTIKIVLFLSLASFAFAGDKPSTEELIRNLSSSDSSDRQKAAEELGARGERLGLEALVKATNDSEPKVQLAVVQAIGKINDPRRVWALTQCVRNTEGAAQKESIHLLTEYYIPSEDRNALGEIWATMSSLFNPPHPSIVEPWIQVDAESVDAIVFVLDDKNSENRMEAAATLGILRASQALPRLVHYLRSPDEKVVRTCIRSIGYIGRSEAGADLIPLLKHSNQDVVLDAAVVLGVLRYKPALKELQHLLDYTNDNQERRIALQAISRIGDPSSEPTIRKYLTSKDKEMLQYAIEGVGRMRLTGYVETLERQFQQENSKQIKLADCFSLFALGRTAYMDTIVRSLNDGLYKDQARGYLLELGVQAVPSIAEYLRTADKELKIRVIAILGDMHRPEAIPHLEPFLKDKDLDIAQAATNAIRELKQIQNLRV